MNVLTNFIPLPGPLRYLAYTRAAVARVLAYRVNFWMGAVGTVLGMTIQYYLWTAIYHGEDGALAGYGAVEALTYVILGQALQGFLHPEGDPLGRKVRDGSIAVDLARPADWQWVVFWDYLGGSLFRWLTTGVPAMVLFTVVGAVAAPPSLGAFLVFLVSAFLGFVLLFAWHFLFGLLSFWTKGGGLIDLKATAVSLFSGALVPLEFYPPGLRRMAMALPFRGIYYLPLSIYTGRLGAGEAAGALGWQAAWAVGLFLMARVLWRRATRSLVIHGG